MALTKAEKSVLDTIAYAEGTLGVSNNGYDVIVTFKTINGWTKDTKIVHGGSDWLQKVGDSKSAAAGRYQFLPDTWKSLNGGVNVPLTKDNQDNACINLIKKKLLDTKSIDSRSVTIEELPNDKSKFDIFLQKCAPTWASLPLTKDVIINGVTKKAGNGFYSNQGGKKTAQELYDVFMLAYGKY